MGDRAALDEIKKKVEEKEATMERWFKAFQVAELKALDEANARGVTSTQTKMDKQYAAILLKATFSMNILKNNVETWLESAKNRCSEEWEELTQEKSNFLIEKAKL